MDRRHGPRHARPQRLELALGCLSAQRSFRDGRVSWSNWRRTGRTPKKHLPQHGDKGNLSDALHTSLIFMKQDRNPREPATNKKYFVLSNIANSGKWFLTPKSSVMRSSNSNSYIIYTVRNSYGVGVLWFRSWKNIQSLNLKNLGISSYVLFVKIPAGIY